MTHVKTKDSFVLITQNSCGGRKDIINLVHGTKLVLLTSSLTRILPVRQNPNLSTLGLFKVTFTVKVSLP
jgi:hypothetical protein